MDQARSNPNQGHEHLENIQQGSVLDSLIDKFEKILETLENQNGEYEVKFSEFKVGIKELVLENERLSDELKHTIETHIQSLEEAAQPMLKKKNENIYALQQQVFSATEEKENVLEMWRLALREIERLETELQGKKTNTDIASLQLQTDKIKSHYNQVIATLNGTVENFKEDARKTREENHAKSVQISELRLTLENMKEQVLNKSKELSSTLEKQKEQQEEVNHLQEIVASLRTNLASNMKELIEYRDENQSLKVQLNECMRKKEMFEDNQNEMIQQLKDSIQMAEDAVLEKDQALLKIQHNNEEIERLKQALSQLLEEAGVRTKQEVESVEKTFNIRLAKLEDEVKSLEKKNSTLMTEADRAQRDKKSLEVEMERLYKDMQEGDLQQAYSNLQTRLVQAEHRTSEALRDLELTKSKLRTKEADHREDSKQWMADKVEMQKRIRDVEQDCQTSSVNNVRLTEQVEHLDHQLRNTKRQLSATQKKMSKEVIAVEEERSVLENMWAMRLQNTEESNQTTCNELKALLSAQQKLNTKWKAEVKSLTESMGLRLNEMQLENLHLRKRNVELSNALKERTDKCNQLSNQRMELASKIQNIESK